MTRGRQKKECRDLASMKISAPEAANLLRISERTFNRYVESGIIPKSDYGEYILGEVINGFWHNQLDNEGFEVARTRLTTAQAEMKELELAEMRGELHRASAISEVWAKQVMNAKTRLLAIPTKTAPELVGKDLATIASKLKNAIYEALYELAGYDPEEVKKVTEKQRKNNA